MKLSPSPFTAQNRFTGFIWQGDKQRRIITGGASGLSATTPSGEQKPQESVE